MNRKQRDKNRCTADGLYALARIRERREHICENCGEKGAHWIQVRGASLQAIVEGRDDQQGFWTCPKYYGPNGRRLPEHTEAAFTVPALGAAFADVLIDNLTEL